MNEQVANPSSDEVGIYGRRARGYELQYRTGGTRGHWVSIFGDARNGRHDEASIRSYYASYATDYFETGDDKGSGCEWRIVRVVEEVVEPSRTSPEVVEWLVTPNRDDWTCGKCRTRWTADIRTCPSCGAPGVQP